MLVCMSELHCVCVCNGVEHRWRVAIGECIGGRGVGIEGGSRFV